jgi:hypothetical protein
VEGEAARPRAGDAAIADALSRAAGDANCLDIALATALPTELANIAGDAAMMDAAGEAAIIRPGDAAKRAGDAAKVRAGEAANPRPGDAIIAPRAGDAASAEARSLDAAALDANALDTALATALATPR